MTPKHPGSKHNTQSSTPHPPRTSDSQDFETSEDGFQGTARKFVLETLKEKILQEDIPPHTRENSTPATPTALLSQKTPIPEGKNYFRVREVAALLKVGPHVLRFWENEFSMVRPTKSRSGQRIYRRKDVEVLERIQHMLHVQKLTIRQARETLLRERRERPQSAPQKPKPATTPPVGLKEILADLRQLIKFCNTDPFAR